MNGLEYLIDFLTNPLALVVFVFGYIVGILSMFWTFERKQSNEDIKATTDKESKTDIHNASTQLASKKEDDISEETRLERAKKMLIESEISNDAKNKFIAKLLHDIRDSLNVIIGTTQLVESEESVKVPVKNIVNPINNASNKLLSITEEISEFSTRYKGGAFLSVQKAHFNLESLCRELVNEERPSAEKNRTPIVFTFSPDLPKFFFADSHKISHMLSLLLDYAMRFTKEGAIVLKISGTGERETDSENRLPVEFKIEFNSKELQFEDSESAFDFTSEDIESSKRSGNIRLGLAICEYLAETFNGRLVFNKSPDDVVTFSTTILLPVKTKEKTRVYQKEEKELADTSILEGKKALLVEDEPANREIVKIFLQRIGFSVDTAGDGLEAIEMVKYKRYDIVFMDCDMPILDGFSATRRIREIENENKTRTPIIAMTGFALSGDKEKCIESGMDDYISKPVNVKSLFEISLKNLKK